MVRTGQSQSASQEKQLCSPSQSVGDSQGPALHEEAATPTSADRAGSPYQGILKVGRAQQSIKISNMSHSWASTAGATGSLTCKAG